SAPASISARIVAASLDAGPMVTRIRVRRTGGAYIRYVEYLRYPLTPRIHERLRDLQGAGGLERVVNRAEPVRLRADRRERHVVMALARVERAEKMARLTAPAAADVEVLAIDVLVRVDRAVAGVRVVAGDDIRAAVAREAHALLERARRSGRLDDDVRAKATR